METTTLQYFATIATTLLLFLLLTFPSTDAARSSPTSNFIAVNCQTANYPKLCVSSLSAHSKMIQNNPLELAKTSVSISLDAASSAVSLMSRLSASGGAMTPREKAAVGDCAATVGDAAAQLRKSLEAMARGDGGKRRETADVRTWVSAALTDGNMCLEGFRGKETEGETKRVVVKEVDNVVKLTSNALAFVNKL